MKLTRRCLYCRSKYTPDPRSREVQKTCHKLACRRKRRSDADRNWREKNQGYQSGRNTNISKWATRRAYWKKYRRKNSSYVKHNRDSSKLRIRMKRAMFATPNDLKTDPIRFLNAIRHRIARSHMFATPDDLRASLVGILSYLIHKECLQHQTTLPPNIPPRYDGDPVVLSELGRQKTPSPKAVTDH